ncbi:uncharacterized protein F4822DRAFT_389657 [Hypoxylon trugodes]|uniref:uncharacterized protein n=1 Tax=Hypoxylon trugodes TaxID=326681 RepID=UPI0021973F74|nr:uncharacterized protein F4822DRAFT_389657 [Hypoxylon trugodes]KAI1392115.1 hypothetical protein F4822DRAFT_389657 [Hypoxylon trugodes]
MDPNNHRQRVDYSENVAPKYPASNQESLEVVPNNSPLYPIPPHTPTYARDYAEGIKPNTASGVWTDTFPSTAVSSEKPKEDDRKRILGLTVPVFWTLLVVIVVILAGGIGGGIGGGLTVQKSVEHNPTTTSSPTSSQSGTPAATSGPLPSDGGCPTIDQLVYMPYAVDAKAIPFVQGGDPQEFKQQCYTNYVSSKESNTHDILRIFMPTLENCMMACAEYNSAYHANLQNGTGVGGGYCMAVSIVKVDAGFCYLKNGTTTNDTMGQPDTYSSAVLLTKIPDTSS